MRITGVDTGSPGFVKAQARFRERANPEEAAEAILKGVRRNRYTSHDIRLIHAVQRHCPAAYSPAMRALNPAAKRMLPAVQQARRRNA